MHQPHLEASTSSCAALDLAELFLLIFVLVIAGCSIGRGSLQWLLQQVSATSVLPVNHALVTLLHPWNLMAAALFL